MRECAPAFRIVLVWRFDRFAHSTTHLLHALAEFQKHEIDLISLSENIDTSTPMGKMIFTILGAVAELERSLLQERVAAGLDRARRQGKRFGRTPATFDEEKLAQLVKIGASVSAMARELGVARSTARWARDRWRKAYAERFT